MKLKVKIEFSERTMIVKYIKENTVYIQFKICNPVVHI